VRTVKEILDRPNENAQAFVTMMDTKKSMVEYADIDERRRGFRGAK
jgi:hypothetical protein